MYLNKSPEELIDAWVAKLEDPNAKQTKGKLKRGDGQCCLGVYCDILEEINPEQVEDNPDYLGGDGIQNYVYLIDGARYDTYPPVDVMHRIGLTHTGELRKSARWQIPEGLREKVGLKYSEDEGVTSYAGLATFNDELDFTFAEIASIIKHNKAKMIELSNA